MPGVAGRFLRRAQAVLAAGLCLVPTIAQGQARLAWLVSGADLHPRTGTVALVALDATGLLADAGNPQVSSVGGDLAVVERGLVSTWRYRVAGQSLTLKASRPGFAPAEITLAAGPSATRVEVTSDPERPVKGRDKAAKLFVELKKADGTPDVAAGQPVLRANVGMIEDVVASGPGRFTATYRLPVEPQPEVAIVAAFAPWPHEASAEGGFGRLIVPLATAFALAGRSEADAEVTLEIAGQTFGPVRTDTSGRFEVPIVAPPGHRIGRSSATDRMGNRRTKPLDLRLPPTDQIACVANPLRLAADGESRARILCVATDTFGKAAKGARLGGQAAAGRLEGPVERGEGTYEWTYAAPKPGPMSDEVTFVYPAGGPASRERLTFELVPPPPALLDLAVEPTLLFGNGPGGVLTAKPRTAAGAPALGARVTCVWGTGTVNLRADGGTWTGRIQPRPVAAVAEDSVACRALPSAGDGVATIRLWVATGAVGGEALDATGRPVPGAALVSAGKRIVADDAGLFVVPNASPPSVTVARDGRSAVTATLHLLRSASGVVAWPASGPPAVPTVSARIQLAPASEVDVRLEASGRQVTYRVVDVATGNVLAGRQVSVHVTGGAAGEVSQHKDGSGRFEVKPSTAARAQVSVTDVGTGVTGAIELQK